MFKGHFAKEFTAMWTQPNHGIERGNQYGLRGLKYEIKLLFKNEFIDGHFVESIHIRGWKYAVEGKEIVAELGEYETTIECPKKYLTLEELRKAQRVCDRIAYGKGI